MQRFVFLTAVVLALFGCNGGEDFSDASVPGCPAGTQCRENVTGDVYIELVSPRVANIGYECGESLGRTLAIERTQGSTTIPAFSAVCPTGARSVEFFVGSGLFEGNKVSLGYYLLPQQLKKGSYQATMADLILPPTRDSISLSALNRAALVQALDFDGNIGDEVRLPVKASDGSGIDVNEVFDGNPDLIPGQSFDGYANYSDFVIAWEAMLDEVDTQLSAEGEPAIAHFDSDTTAYQSRLELGTDRTRAGLYSFESAGECLIFEGCDFGGSDGSRLALAMSALVLPSGEVLAGGQLLRSKNSDTELDFVGLESAASLSETLQFKNSNSGALSVRFTGAGIGATTPGVTDAQLRGRILGQTMYAGIEINGSGDYGLDYPNASYALKGADKGELEGELLGESVPDDSDSRPMPVRGTKTGAVQVELDPTLLADVAGDYRVTLMRPCIGEASDNVECRSIPNPELEIGNQSGFNYPSSIERGDTTAVITSERSRADENMLTDFCVTISDGIVSTGENGSCGTTYRVGMVTRTFQESNSVNVNLRLAPGMDVRSSTPHYNTAIEGRIDLDEACSPMFRLSDDSFDAQVRAAWVEQIYYPAIQRSDWADPEQPTDEEELIFASLQAGAVIFGEDGCTP